MEKREAMPGYNEQPGMASLLFGAIIDALFLIMRNS
jgi:hypothetical protein